MSFSPSNSCLPKCALHWWDSFFVFPPTYYSFMSLNLHSINLNSTWVEGPKASHDSIFTTTRHREGGKIENEKKKKRQSRGWNGPVVSHRRRVDKDTVCESIGWNRWTREEGDPVGRKRRRSDGPPRPLKNHGAFKYPHRLPQHPKYIMKKID